MKLWISWFYARRMFLENRTLRAWTFYLSHCIHYIIEQSKTRFTSPNFFQKSDILWVNSQINNIACYSLTWRCVAFHLEYCIPKVIKCKPNVAFPPDSWSKIIQEPTVIQSKIKQKGQYKPSVGQYKPSAYTNVWHSKQLVSFPIWSSSTAFSTPSASW